MRCIRRPVGIELPNGRPSSDLLRTGQDFSRSTCSRAAFIPLCWQER